MSDELDRELAAWLEEHVVRPKTPRALILHSFEVQRTEPLSGSFTAELDGEQVAGCRFWTEGNGEVEVGPPLVHSPLGVPATYAAAEFTSVTTRAVEAALRATIPSIEAFGLNRQTGEMVTMMSPFEARLSDPAAYARAAASLQDPTFVLDATPFLQA